MFENKYYVSLGLRCNIVSLISNDHLSLISNPNWIKLVTVSKSCLFITEIRDSTIKITWI